MVPGFFLNCYKEFIGLNYSFLSFSKFNLKKLNVNKNYVNFRLIFLFL